MWRVIDTTGRRVQVFIYSDPWRHGKDEPQGDYSQSIGKIHLGLYDKFPFLSCGKLLTLSAKSEVGKVMGSCMWTRTVISMWSGLEKRWDQLSEKKLANMMVTTVNTMIVLPCFVVSTEAWRAEIASLKFAYFWRRSSRWLICGSVSGANPIDFIKNHPLHFPELHERLYSTYVLLL